MKQTPLILSILSLVAVAALGIMLLVGNGSGKKASAGGEVSEVNAREGAIVWFDFNRLIQDYDMYNDRNAVVSSKAQSIQDEITRRGNRFQSEYNKFQSDVNNGVLLRSVAEERSQKLQAQQNNLNQYIQQKQQEMAEEQTVMMNEIYVAIRTYLEKYNEDKKYSIILSTNPEALAQDGTALFTSPVALGDPSLDITAELVAGLNEEYIKAKKGTAGAAAADTTAKK